MRFFFDYHTLPLWLYTEDDSFPMSNHPILDDYPEINDRLERIEKVYNSLFIATKIEFGWKGFDSEEDKEKFKTLVRETIAMIHEAFDGEYEIVDDSHLDRLDAEPSVSVSPFTQSPSAEPQKLKFTPENVLAGTWTAEGKPVWIEIGDARSGLQHLLSGHTGDFLTMGIQPYQVPDLLMTALDKGKIIAYQKDGQTLTHEQAALLIFQPKPPAPIYRVRYHRHERDIAINLAPNGFVVSANTRKTSEKDSDIAVLKLSPEWNSFPLWAYEEENSAPLFDHHLLDEHPQIRENLVQIEKTYSDQFIATKLEFSWKGFDSEEEKETYKTLVRETLAMLHKTFDGEYEIIDDSNLDSL